MPGSSPLARGTLKGVPRCPLHPRLIPARAGNTLSSTGKSLRRPAHPRSRGEHSGVYPDTGLSVGSSPLARGTRLHHVHLIRSWRLIPARAGNTAEISERRLLNSAHPRSRGEHTRQISSRTPELGSSPLARGTHSQRCPGKRRPRLIPARAGNTYESGRG